MSDDSDVLVVGGGIIGLAIAREAARSGFETRPPRKRWQRAHRIPDLTGAQPLQILVSARRAFCVFSK